MKLRTYAWLILVIGMFFTRWEYLDDVIYNIDEAEYAVAADGLDHGWLPGVDLLGSTKPPGISVFYNLLFHTFDRSMTVVHVAHLLVMIAAGFALVELAIALWGLLAAVPVALLYWMVSSSFGLPSETLAFNVESTGMLFAVIALLLAWKWPEKLWMSGLVGLSLGISTLFRPSFLIFLAPLFSIAFLKHIRKLPYFLSVLLGIGLPWLVVIIVYAKAGGLSWAWDSWVRYPMTYSGDLGLLGFLSAMSQNNGEFAQQSFVPLGLAIWGGVILWRERKSTEAIYLWIILPASFIALCAGSRFFGHYFIQVYPVVALFGVPAWMSLSTNQGKLKKVFIVLAGTGIVLALLHFPLFEQLDRGGRPAESLYSIGADKDEYEIADFARTNTDSSQTIAVWGYCPQLYYLANRLPGVRDYLCHYITGYSPGSFDPLTERAIRPYARSDAEAMFIEDLKARRPKYVFDLVQRRDYIFNFFLYSIRRYPQVTEYLRTNYLPEGEIKGVFIYRLRTPEDTWWPEKKDIE